MFDRHCFQTVEGDNLAQVTKALVELHEADDWCGLHGRWKIDGVDAPQIETWHADYTKGQANIPALYDHVADVNAAVKAMDAAR
jgi:hypothetical protein